MKTTGTTKEMNSLISFKNWFEENYNEQLPNGNIDGDWFDSHRLPMIVHCTCCEMTMALPSAMIDANGYTYCTSCAE